MGKNNNTLKFIKILLYIITVFVSGSFAILLEHLQQFGSGIISIVAGYPLSFERLIELSWQEYGFTVLISMVAIILLGIAIYFVHKKEDQYKNDNKIMEKLDKIIEILQSNQDSSNAKEQIK